MSATNRSAKRTSRKEMPFDLRGGDFTRESLAGFLSSRGPKTSTQTMLSTQGGHQRIAQREYDY
jgi:hypothetical protein